MSEKALVLAVIPSYNMAESLAKLLQQTNEQTYSGVVVLDDASTDNTSEVVEGFKDVRYVKGETNVGPGANRNRILPFLDKLGKEALLHFIDADVELDSSNNPDTIRSFFKDDQSLGLVGGLIELPDSQPWIFNYGPRYSLYSQLSGWAHAKTYNQLTENKNKPTHLFHYTSWLRKDYPDPLKQPEVKETYWVSEANMVIPSKIFRQVDGFDPGFRYHEAQDLAIKLHDHGYKVMFDPKLSVIHPPIDINDMSRKALESRAGLQLMRKYGIHIK